MPEKHDKSEILEHLTDKERSRARLRIRFAEMEKRIRELADKHGLALAEVSARAGYARYSLTSQISQTKTTGRMNMPVVEAALEYLEELDSKETDE